MKETERKFLETGDFPKDGIKYIDITQGYIYSDKEHVVRVRIADDKVFMTIKGPNKKEGVSHLEIEKTNFRGRLHNVK